MALVLLVATLALLGLYLRGDVAEFLKFAKLARSSERRSRYAQWLLKHLIVFVAPTLVGLALLGRLGALTALPSEFDDAAAAIGVPDGLYADEARFLLLCTLIGVVIGSVLAWALSRWRKRPPRTVGKIDSILPRNRAELPYGAMLSLSAGISEELMFRLFLPLLITLASGSWVAGFAVSVAIFGAMHRYQGWVGVVATTLVGLVLTWVYLATRSIAIAMTVHAMLDVNALVIRPLLTGALQPAAD